MQIPQNIALNLEINYAIDNTNFRAFEQIKNLATHFVKRDYL